MPDVGIYAIHGASGREFPKKPRKPGTYARHKVEGRAVVETM